MASPQEIRNPNNGPDPKEKNPQKDDRKINPGKPGSDPDQTPEREIDNPPVADPKQPNQKPNKIGF